MGQDGVVQGADVGVGGVGGQIDDVGLEGVGQDDGVGEDGAGQGDGCLL